VRTKLIKLQKQLTCLPNWRTGPWSWIRLCNHRRLWSDHRPNDATECKPLLGNNNKGNI